MILAYGRSEFGCLWQAADRRWGLTAANLAGQAPPAERTPHDGPYALIQGEWHQLPLVVAANQGVKRLIGDIARIAIAVGRRQGFHEVPARKVGDAYITDLSGTYESVQRREHFLGRRLRV